MWHQVLTHPDAYPETSCTAMFAYAFARGVQFGWLENTEPYIQSVIDAWTGINTVGIDKLANVHGVCRGSEFSYSPEYYKKELLPNLNDTHGVGIVLLAGVETHRLIQFLKNSDSANNKSSNASSKAAASRSALSSEIAPSDPGRGPRNVATGGATKAKRSHRATRG
jgi:hypothetical protein